MFSISPAPNVGVGMRKMTLFVATAVAKGGCGMPLFLLLVHPGGESTRPTMV